MSKRLEISWVIFLSYQLTNFWFLALYLFEFSSWNEVRAGGCHEFSVFDA